MAELKTDKIIQVGNWTQNAKRDNPQRGRVYDPRGIAPTLNCMGGNLQPFIILYDEPKVKQDNTEVDSAI